MKQPSKVERYGSLLVDLITIILIIIILSNSPSFLVKFTAVPVTILYFPAFHTLLSRTIGDIVFRLKVVDRQGGKISVRLALNRLSCVFRYSIFAALFTNLLFMFIMLFTGSVRDISEISFDYEEESGTYLVKATNKLHRTLEPR